MLRGAILTSRRVVCISFGRAEASCWSPGVLQRNGHFAPMPDGPGAPAGANFDAGGHPPPALIPADAASVLTLLESAYDAAHAQDSAVIDNLARLRTPLAAILGA